MEHTFYAGGHREVVRVGDTTNQSVATSSVTATVLHVKTTPVSGSPTTAFEYLHRDHLGSVESVTDGTGAELKVQAYDPFGGRRTSDWTRSMSDAELTALAGESPQRTARGYTGHEHLERTGLIHMNGRVYDPVIGRFLSPDPIVADASFSQSWNAYSYALNSPLSYSDPTGFYAKTATVYGDRSWDYASLSMLESLLWNSFYHSHQLPLYFNESFDAQLWNDGVLPGSAAVPLQGAVGVGEEMGPADRPMGGLGSAVLDIGQAAIGLGGLIPIVGNAADVLNAGISTARGNYGEAILDGASAVPGAGHVSGAVMAGVRGKRAVSGIWDAISGTRRGPAPNQRNAKPHGGPRHNDAIDRRVEELSADPSVSNIRKNQVQVDVHGRRVGNNRPDIQYDQCGVHHCVEYDTFERNSVRHRQVIRRNDPNTGIELNVFNN